MTITIFEDKDCKGKSQVLTGSIADLKNHPADKPGSIRLTEGLGLPPGMKLPFWAF